MPREPFKAKGSSAVLQLQAIKEAKRAREQYEATGELQSLDDAPFLNVAWHAAQCAVRYALELGGTVEHLPKRFDWLGVTYQLCFPAEGPVQIIDPSTEENLCVGFNSWVDPMRVKPKKTA